MTSKLRNNSELVRNSRWMLDDANLNKEKCSETNRKDGSTRTRASCQTTSHNHRTDFSLRCVLRIRPFTNDDKVKEKLTGNGRGGAAAVSETETEILLVESKHALQQYNSPTHSRNYRKTNKTESSNLDFGSDAWISQNQSHDSSCQDPVSVRLIPPPSFDNTGSASVLQRAKTSQNSITEGDIYNFDSVFGSETTQQDLYEGIVGMDKGLIQSVMDVLGNSDTRHDGLHPNFPATDSSETILKNHLLISLGVSNSGKTHSLFGPTLERNRELSLPTKDDGLVKRILYDLFSMGSCRIKNLNSAEKNVSSRTRRSAAPMMEFAIQLSMVYVYHDHVYDMLSHYDELKENDPIRSKASQKQEMTQLRFSQHPETKDFITSPHVIAASSLVDACTIISHGVNQGHTAPTLLNEDSSRGHTLITIRPVVVFDSKVIRQGGTISVLDMAGIERTSQQSIFSKVSTNSDMKTSISINASISTLLQCLRALKLKNSQKQINDDKAQYDAAENQSVPSSPTNDFPILAGHITKSDNKNTTPLKENHNNHHFVSPKSLLRRRFAQSPALVKQDENQYDSSVITQKSKQSNHQDKMKTENKICQKAVIPFRDNKLTMLLQPLLSGNGSTFMTDGSPRRLETSNQLIQTAVSLIVFAYPGRKDYFEKKYLLGEVSSLVGLSWSQQTISKNDAKSRYASTKEKLPEEEVNIKKTIQLHQKNGATNDGDNVDPIGCSTDLTKQTSFRINELEKENSSLKDENKQLKRTIEELINNISNRSVVMDEKKTRENDFLEFRAVRRKQQTLLKSPLRDHMKTVEEHRMIETGTVRRNPVIGEAPFPISVERGRKRLRAKNCIMSEDDVQLWKYLGCVER